MAGPETSPALGQPNFGELGPITTPDTSGQQAASTTLAQQQPIQPQQQGGGLKVGLQGPQLNPNRTYSAHPNRTYSAQEFYPGQERPNESRTAAGDPLFAASAGRIPWGIIADRAAQIQKQKAELSDYFRKQQDQFSGQAAPQYERDYQAWAANQDAQFKKDWADAHHGGNINAALEDLYKNPASNAAYQARMRDVKAAGVANKFYTTQAQDYIDGVLSGSVQPDPDLLREAQWFTSANAEFGPNSDSAAMRADHAKMWDKLVSRDKLFTDYYSKELAHAQDEAQAAGRISWRNGVRVIDETLKKDYDQFIDKAAREMTHKYGTGSYEENKRFLESRLGDYEVTNTTAAPRPSSGSPQANKKPSVGFAEVGFDATVPGLHQVEGDGFKRRTPMSISMPLKDGDNKPFTESFRFNDNAGTPMRIIPDGFRLNDKGEVFIVGRNADVTQTETKDAEKLALLKARIGDAEAMLRKAQSDNQPQETLDVYIANRDKYIKELSEVEREVTKEKPPVPIPLKGNEAKVKTYFGEQVYNDVMQQAAAAKQSKPTASAPAKTTPEDFNAKWAKLPKGGKLVGPDGVTYEKK